MNLFTNHNFGGFADDGFGNLIRLSRNSLWIALHVTIGYCEYGDDFYDV